MSDERAERLPTDEPDGTSAHAASLRPPGESVQPGTTHEVTDEEIAPDPAPVGDDPVGSDGVEPGAGYDVEAVSGDTDVYRP
jgi:hypothetical protein